jgi:hypothetical protein
MSASAREAVRAGAVSALVEIFARRRPDLAVEVTFGELDADRGPGGNAADAEVRGLEAAGDDPNPVLDVAPPPLDPDDAERAA